MRLNGPWKIEGSLEKYKNHWMKVREDKVIQPDGKDSIVGVVELRDGVSILALDDDGYVYLVEQFRYILSRKSIEVVGGGIDDDEDPLNAAKRELKEEAGIIAEEWVFMEKFHPFTAAIKSSNIMYLARKLKFTEASPEGTEQIKILKVKFEDALKMVMGGEITQGPSCVIILKTSEYLKNINKVF